MRRRKLLLVGSIGIGVWLLSRSRPVHAIVQSTRSGAPQAAPEVLTAPAGFLTRQFDSIYRAQCGRVPVEYLRALAHQESRSNPGETKGACWGLLQVCPCVLESYNERFGTSWSMGTDMLRADRNAQVACELIQRIPGFYVKQHPRAFPGGFSFTSRRHVELLTMGWNAGWSESRGVSGAIGKLLSFGYGPSQITIDAISRASRAGRFPSKFTAKLGQKNVVPWVRDVSGFYFRELRAPGV